MTKPPSKGTAMKPACTQNLTLLAVQHFRTGVWGNNRSAYGTDAVLRSAPASPMRSETQFCVVASRPSPRAVPDQADPSRLHKIDSSSAASSD